MGKRKIEKCLAIQIFTHRSMANGVLPRRHKLNSSTVLHHNTSKFFHLVWCCIILSKQQHFVSEWWTFTIAILRVSTTLQYCFDLWSSVYYFLWTLRSYKCSSVQVEAIRIQSRLHSTYIVPPSRTFTPWKYSAKSM